MSRIKRIEVHEFAFELPGLGWDSGGFNIVYQPDNKLKMSKCRFRGRMTVMLDPVCELRTFADTLAVGRACDEAGFLWYEDPMRDGGCSQFAHRKLRQIIKTPLLQTEHVRGLEPKADFIVNDSTDFVRADPEYDLGITGTMKIAHLAEAFGLDVELHAPGPAHRHCMTAIRNTNFYELALVGPKCGNAMPPVYADAYTDQLDGARRTGSGRDLRLGFHQAPPHPVARVPVVERVASRQTRCQNRLPMHTCLFFMGFSRCHSPCETGMDDMHRPFFILSCATS